ncbi:MAG: hypothetical protein ACYYK0_05695 [Candidatus Eutrophobiaceae bacterium]
MTRTSQAWQRALNADIQAPCYHWHSCAKRTSGLFSGLGAPEARRGQQQSLAG